MKKAGKQIEWSPDEIYALSQRLQTKSLSDEDYEGLLAMLEVILTLNEALRQKDVSIKRLLKRIFGMKTEKRDKLFDDKKKTEDTPSQPTDENKHGENKLTPGTPPSNDSHPSADRNDSENTGNDDSKPTAQSKKGHGRKGVDDFTGAERQRVEHPDLKPGDDCPLLCPNGRLYRMKPGITLSFSGNAPVTATIFEFDRLRCNACGALFKAEVSEGVVTGVRQYETSAKAAISIYKYGFGMPFYRISKLQEMLGLPLGSSTLWDKTEELANTVHPIYLEMERQAAQGKVLHNDDTSMPVLSLIKENENRTDKERTGMFTTGILSILEAGTKVALFYTGRNHAGENLDALQEFRDSKKDPPIQMCDALSRNTNENFKRLVAHCIAHGRRTFVDIIPIFPDECKFVIDTLADVYKNDAVTKKQGMSDKERLTYHQEHSTPIMEKLHEWMNEQIDGKNVEPNSVLGKAISYMLKHWSALTLFLTVAGAPLDNNLCEQILKRVVLNRKNAMFYKNEHGAYVGDMFMSIIHTCYLMKINPMDYLIKLQEYESHLRDEPEKWMPWNYIDTIAQIESNTIVI